MPSMTFISREKSVPGFKASKDMLPLFCDFLLTPVLTYRSEKPRALNNYAKSTLLYKWNKKVWMTAHLFMTWFSEYLSPLEIYCSPPKKKIQNITDNAPGHPRALLEMYEINVVFMPADTTSILQPMGQGVTNFHICCFFSSCFFDFHICKKYLLGQNININRGVWKKLISTLMDDFGGFKTSVEDVTADVMETAKELELEVKPDDGSQLLQSHD
ncbi:hypothetical protein QTO34_009199 [Cnephaeus nilssonii]|uniref:DDE-1 domain-containing protein n=1 Tax=Cnephaeus nilssonii TaxID=3371016 RepID=A0AA40HHE6_CNENI|nr:hypothetical protein QTO34_009199 [Eptesicus nilssonii]